MEDGIYNATYSALGRMGQGLLVVRDNALNGGDALYLIQGALRELGDSLSASITVKRWNPQKVPGIEPIFPVSEYTAEFNGTGKSGTFHVSAKGPGGAVINVSGTRVAPLFQAGSEV